MTSPPPSWTSLGTGAEFDLIRKLLGPQEPLPEGVRTGPGDDALVLEDGWVLSVDLTVEDVHFKREWIDLEEAGFRATAAALSDLAAMGARPVAVLLSLGLPRREMSETATALQKGADEACRREGIRILGGDVTASSGPALVDVVALGRTDRPLLRGGSRPGDQVWVTGWLGASAAALHLWNQGREPGPELRRAFARPTPRIREARWLAERLRVRGLIDVSDGLGGDAGHLAAAAGVGILLRREALPVHRDVTRATSDRDEVLRLALTGGEDYELCFTVEGGALEPWIGPFQETFGIPLTRVGRVVEGEGVRLEESSGDTRPLELGGFSHVQAEDDR